MNIPKSGLSKYGFIFHAIIGGVICLFLSAILYAFLQVVVEGYLGGQGILGVLIFSDAATGMQMLSFGLAFLPAGFVGGLYGGFKIKENLRFTLGLPGIIGFIINIAMTLFGGGLSVLILDPLRTIIIPLTGDVLGSYLGGYMINWTSRETHPEEESKQQPETVVQEPASAKRHKN